MIEILALYSNNIPTPAHTIADSIWRGMLRVPEDFRPTTKLKKLGLFGRLLHRSLDADYDRLGYVNDWKVALSDYKEARVDF